MNNNYHHPGLAAIVDPSDWYSSVDIAGDFAVVFDHQGLLTDQLKTLADTNVSVQCVMQQYNEDNSAQRRDVVIFVDDNPRVLASTIIPEIVLQNYPSLLSLGDQPLGEYLEVNFGAKRMPPKIRKVTADDRMNSNFFESGQCYLRRYHYVLEHGKITIVELFSPKILKDLRDQLTGTQEIF